MYVYKCTYTICSTIVFLDTEQTLSHIARLNISTVIIKISEMDIIIKHKYLQNILTSEWVCRVVTPLVQNNLTVYIL